MNETLSLRLRARAGIVVAVRATRTAGTRHAPRCFGLTVLIMALAALAPRAHAQGQITRTGDGLTLDAYWWGSGVGGGGYLPVEVHLANSAGPRQLRVVVEAQGYPDTTYVSRTIELDRNGQASFTLSIPITSYSVWGVLKVYERGRELEKLRTQSVSATAYWTGSPIPGVVIISRSAPDLRLFNDAVVRVMAGGTQQPNQQPVLLAPEHLPTQWIDYTSADLVLLSFDQLKQASSLARQAIVEWCLAGGNLVVYGLGAEAENLPEFRSLLDLEDRPPGGAAWQVPRAQDRTADVLTQTAAGVATRAVATPATPASDDAAAAAAASVPPRFRMRPFGFGRLVTMSDADPYPGTIEDWAWLLRTIDPRRISWTQRHGMTGRGANPDFWNFLVAGVGRAPVGVFQLLIVVFAALIGPVNYLVLRRRKQLYLLIGSVPVFAALTTVLLVGYAVASDGFGVRARVRSVTLLDQRRGEAVSWSRVSYYAGLAPRGGLHFSRDTAVFAMEPEDSSRVVRRLDWTEDQNFQSGWLRSRTPTQLLTISYRATDQQLAVASDAQGRVRVENRLGAPARWVFLASEQGALYAAEDLSSGASVLLAPVELDEAKKTLRLLMQDHKLELPDEIVRRSFSGAFFAGTRRFRPWFGGTTVASSNSLLEQALGLLADQGVGLPGLLGARSYVAVVDRAPPLELTGVRQAEDAGSLYVVWGAY